MGCKFPMASMSTHGTFSSSSTSSTPHWSYDVFLSFYGFDTRKTFADQIYTAMKDRGISVYRDSEELKQGTFIGPKLMKAIEESRYAITILSRNYAFSSWSLDELVEIVKCMKETQLTILPIFYHVKPSHVRNKTKTYKKAFSKHEKDAEVNKEKIQTWRAALRKVGDIARWHIHDR